ncbi:17483_t:CDS:1, partial [Rhizophagus irregularis]
MTFIYQIADLLYDLYRDVNGSVHPVFGPKTGGLSTKPNRY